MSQSTKYFILLLAFLMTHLTFSKVGNSIVASENSILSVEKINFKDNLIFVTAKLADGEAREFLLDSGCEAILLDEKLEISNGFETLPIKVHGAFGKAIGLITNADFIEFAGIKFQNVPVVQADLSRIQKRFPKVAGILGKTIFDLVSIEIDYSKGFLTLHESEKVARNLENTNSQKISFDSSLLSNQTPLAQGETDFGDSFFIFDTGFRGSLLVNQNEYSENSPKNIRCSGLNSDIFASSVALEDVSIGDVEFEKTSGIYTDRLKPLANSNVGIVGNEILKNYRVVFDYPNSALWLTENVERF